MFNRQADSDVDMILLPPCLSLDILPFAGVRVGPGKAEEGRQNSIPDVQISMVFSDIPDTLE